MADKKPLSPGRIARLLQNPGTRAALDSKFLSPQQRQQRQMNTRLNAPVTQGSSMTNRDLAHSRNAALQVAYGPREQVLGQQLSAQQQQGRDMQSAYDLYVNDLRQHAQNVQAGNQQATQALTALTGNVGALKSDVGTAGPQVQQDAQNATAVRQALVGSFGAQQISQGKSANDYADTLANVVGPGQKLSARAQSGRNEQAVRGQQSALAAQKSAAGQKFDADTIASEFKNVLAGQALGLNAAKADTTAAAGRATRREQRRHNQAQETNAQARQTAAAGKVNAYGYTDADWRALSTPERQKVIKDFKGGKSKGAGWLPQGQMGAGLSQLPSLKSYATKAKSGEAFVAGHKPQGPLSRKAAGQKIVANVAAAKHPVLLTAALDAAYDGHLSPPTVKALIAAGYKPSQVAQALGVPTAGGLKPMPRPKAKPKTPPLPTGSLTPPTPLRNPTGGLGG